MISECGIEKFRTARSHLPTMRRIPAVCIQRGCSQVVIATLEHDIYDCVNFLPPDVLLKEEKRVETSAACRGNLDDPPKMLRTEQQQPPHSLANG
jgi:hypothetical protein